ncbi:MAG: dTMP kinase [Clostridiales bacterium]|nr:dTMP kinase [Clostridiales bacterium]
MEKGYFISFEGVDGSGKSTQIKKLKQYLEGRGYHVVLTREPGGTAIGEKIRDIILDPENSDMTDMTEAMLYAASRSQHVSRVIEPALVQGKIVICDRFVDSSIAYQGYGRKLGDCVGIINEFVIGENLPDLTVWMKIKPEITSSRMKYRQKDRIELEEIDFHQRVYDGYEKLEKAFPQRIIGIDATNSIDDTYKAIIDRVEMLLKRNE